jgi:hypothetical protein
MNAPECNEDRPDAQRTAERSGCWWVNHGRSFRLELDAGYLWSRERRRSGGSNDDCSRMRQSEPGDVILSCVRGELRAAGLVLAPAREAREPVDCTEVDLATRGAPGWLLPVCLRLLDRPLRLKDHLAAIAATLPLQHAPIRASGEINPSVRLALLPTSMAQELLRLLDGQVEKIRTDIGPQAGPQWADAVAEMEITQRRDLLPGIKQQLRTARYGRGIFRQNVEEIEQACRVTGVLDRRHLRAGHIKPWRVSDDREKLDGCNGLLFAPHVMHLFERGYISFADSGDLLVSSRLNPSVLSAWGVMAALNVGAFRPEQQAYLACHRELVFEHHGGGRRA